MAAIMKAGGQHDFFTTYNAALELGGAARFPVILGSTDYGGVAVSTTSQTALARRLLSIG